MKEQTIAKVWSYKKGTQCCIKYNKYPEESIKRMKDLDAKFGGRQMSRYDWYCGYVAFPGLNGESSLKSIEDCENETDVHGGITYTKEEEGALIFGFDCNHFGDVDRPEATDLDWLTKETERMADQLIILLNYGGPIPHQKEMS